METVKRLQEYIKFVDFKSYSAKDHRDIYTYVDQKILAKSSPSKDHVPPLDVIIYAIRSILYPSLVLNQIPDLLDLLTTVEFYRNHAISQARDAFIWNAYYKKKGEDPLILTPNQEATLEKLESKSTSLRQLYFSLVIQCCQCDIYNLWTANSSSMTDLMTHMNEYFPRLNKYYTQKSPRLFHFGMSDEEQERLYEAGQDLCKFVRDSHAWAVEHKTKDKPLRSMSQSAEFTAEFPNPIKEENFIRLFEYYLKWVEDSTREFVELFKDDQ